MGGMIAIAIAIDMDTDADSDMDWNFRWPEKTKRQPPLWQVSKLKRNTNHPWSNHPSSADSQRPYPNKNNKSRATEKNQQKSLVYP
ncbi:GL14703 [Drosophila persimilis]|uniref:GL14703 n=1 Tax=Drosophila persimilis TaxID=7234 RepID=B4GVQ8_DROPE|nr:GL14703 [Drosophila persimilis]